MDTETVSKEAHQRITAERDQARKELADHKALLAKAQSALAEAQGRQAYLRHRAEADEKMKALDAELDLVGPQLRGVDPDHLTEAVAKVAAQMDAFRTGTMTTKDPGATGDGEPPSAPPATDTPQFNPNPAAPGVPLQPDKIEVGTDKFNDLYRKGGLPAVRAALADGSLVLSPEVRERHGV